MSGIKARTNFIYLNSEHCMLSTPTPPASLTGSTFPTNIKDPFSHKPQKLQDSWLDCLWRDSSTARPGTCNEAKQQQQKQQFSVNGGCNMLGLYFNPEAQQQPQYQQQQPPPPQDQPQQQQQLEANNFNSTHFSAPYPYTNYSFSMPPISDALEEILHLTPELFDSQQYGNGYYS